MPTFAFTGRTRAGENIAGERVADTLDAVTAMLRREQVLVTKVTPVKAKAEAGPKKGKLGKGVSPKNLAIFTRQFSVMIDAGLPLVQCLEILGSQEEDANFAATILQTRGDVENGQTLADAMRKHPQDVRPAVHQHDRGGRGRRHPRHDPEAPGDATSRRTSSSRARSSRRWSTPSPSS